MILHHAQGLKIVWIALAIMLWAYSSASLQAVVVSDPTAVPDLGTTAPADDPGWGYVGKVNGDSCTYLGDRWVLTCAHVGYNDPVFNGVTCTRIPGSTIPLYQSVGSTTPIDLILFRLEAEPAGLASVIISKDSPAVSTAVTAIGYGKNQETTLSTWGSLSGYKYTAGDSSIKRWGTNAVSGTGLVSVGDGTTTWINHDIFTTFDKNQPAGESQLAPHDSGGGLFTKDTANHVWKLAGINEAVFPPQRSDAAVFGDQSWYVDLSYYRDQIVNLVQVFQFSSTLNNPNVILGNAGQPDWQRVQLLASCGFGTSTAGTWSLPIDTNGFNFTLNSNNNVTLSGAISSSKGSGGLIKDGTGTLTLSAANTFSGVTSIARGTLELSNASALQNSTLNYTTGTLVFDGGVASHAFTLGGLSGSASILLKDALNNAVALSVGNNNADTNYSGILSGAGGSLTKIGSGSLTLTQTPTYTGNTAVTGGILTVPAINTPNATVSVIGAGSSLNAKSIVADTLVISSHAAADSIASAAVLRAGGVVPEPSAIVLLLAGFLSLGAVRWMRRRR
jgi:autotransporter-associated beta strand protein